MTAYILNLFDLFTTLIVLSLGGVELNPFLQDVEVMVVSKVLIGWVVIRWLVYQVESSPLAKRGLAIGTAWFGTLVVNNILVIAYIVYMTII